MESDPLAELLRNAVCGPGAARLAGRPCGAGSSPGSTRSSGARSFFTAGLFVCRRRPLRFGFRSLPVEKSKPTARVDIAGLKREFARFNADADLHERTSPTDSRAGNARHRDQRFLMSLSPTTYCRPATGAIGADAVESRRQPAARPERQSRGGGIVQANPGTVPPKPRRPRSPASG